MRKLTCRGKFLLLPVLSLVLAGPVGAQPAGTQPPGARAPVVRPSFDMSPVMNSPLSKPPVTKPPVTKPPDTKPPVKKPPAAEAPAGLTDYEICLGEFRAAGAFKFYDNTEAILRTANFEQALMRYRFLKGHIQGKADYYGLTASVNRRIQFLKKQLHLRDTEVAAIPPRKMRMIKAKPAVKLPATKPEEEPGAATPKTPEAAARQADRTTTIPGATVTPTPPPQVPVAAPVPTAQKPPPVVTTDAKAKEDEKAEEEKDKEAKPAVPPTFWQRLKLRLHLGKKPDTAKSDSAQ